MNKFFFLKNNLLIILFFLFTWLIIAQNKSNPVIEISGKITYLNTPLLKVTVLLKDKEQGTESDIRGNYSLQAHVGDIIQFSYVGFETISIIIEDVTRILNITMIIKRNDLDETIIIASKIEIEIFNIKWNDQSRSSWVCCCIS